MLNANQASVLTALVSAALVLTITLIRQKRFERTDLGALGTTFFAGYNIPAAIFLCYYTFDPDPPEILAQTKLNGYEKYLCFSGLALLFLSFVTIWSFISSAYKKENSGASKVMEPIANTEKEEV